MAQAKILVVEDEQVVGLFIKKCLETSGYIVSAVVATGEAAVAAAKADPPDLALMDIAIMGEMDGIEAAGQLRFHLNIPAVYLTGLADEQTLERAKRTEPIGYLLKPFDPRTLQTTIESALYQYQASARRAQTTLQRAEENYREMFENSPLGIYRTELSGRLVDANPAMARILGYETSSELMSAVEYVDRDVFEDPARKQELVKLLEQNGIAKNFEARVRRRDGNSIWISTTVRVIQDSQANPQYYDGVVQNITERKLAGDALRESEARLNSVVNAAKDGIIMMDDEGLVTLWSPAAERITGYSPAEVIGRSLHELVAPERLREVQSTAFATWRENGRGDAINATVEVPCLRKDKNEILVELSLSSVNLKDRWAAVGIVRDVSERKNAQLERDRMEVMLRQAQKLESIGQLAAGIAHEINTPTQYVGDNIRFFKDAFADIQNVLQIYGHLMDASKRGPIPVELLRTIESQVQEADLDYILAEIPKAITQTLEGVDRVATIVRAMKDFSHPDSKERVPTNIHKAIESTLIVCRNEYKYVADAVTEFDATMPPVPCFPGDFNQVIMNLIINAAHAIAGTLDAQSKLKGKITIATSHDEKYAEIRVSDTGTGIPEYIRSKIFDPFFTTKEVGKGTGQGLAICHAVVVAKHGGTIGFESQMGQGTTFLIRLPLDSACQASEAA